MDQGAKSTASIPVAERSALEEHFPRIAEALCMVWGKEGCVHYLRSLVFDERGGRQGFPEGAGTELLMLHSLLEYQDAGDVWTQSDQSI